jgi:Ca2+-binding EF-hand superfamily protein
VFVTAGTDDEVVPVAVVERFVADLDRADTVVRFHREEGANHGDMLGAAHDQLIEWTRSLTVASTIAPPATRFSLFDANADGYLTLDDYEVFALRLAQAFGEPPGSPATLAVRRGYRALWQAVASRSDTDTDGRVSQAEFLAWLASTPTAAFDQELAPLAEAVIALADSNHHDGTLDAAEVTRLLRSCDLSAERVTAVFEALDRNHDATVSAGELVAMVRDFCLNPAPGKPGHWLFGQF